MIQIPMTSGRILERSTLSSLNANCSDDFVCAENVLSLNTRKQKNRAALSGRTIGSAKTALPPAGRAGSAQRNNSPARTPVSAPPDMRMPSLLHPVSKGQKSLLSDGNLPRVYACFGWNIKNPECDVDVSAFLLNQSGKVIGDSWFVFYGQTQSPDRSICLKEHANDDRELITIDFTKLNPAVKKIVFVMTIHEAFEKKLHFGMLKDAYIRILNPSDRRELLSFRLTDYYTNVISMAIGEIYQHNGRWKFNAIGNGLARDLAGLCEFYGVQVI